MPAESPSTEGIFTESSRLVPLCDDHTFIQFVSVPQFTIHLMPWKHFKINGFKAPVSLTFNKTGPLLFRRFLLRYNVAFGFSKCSVKVADIFPVSSTDSV